MSGGAIPGTWTWSDAAQFIALFVGIRIAFIWMATRLFVGLIPDGDACPLCDAATLPIERDGWWRVLGERYRRSWCLECQWEGVLRRSSAAQGAVTPPIANRRSQSGQLPLSSKKSSK